MRAGWVVIRQRFLASFDATRQPVAEGLSIGSPSRCGSRICWEVPRLPSSSLTIGLRDYVQDRLAGVVRDADGVVVSGPATVEWKGRNKPRRQDRKWASVWSPEQIANRLRIDYPDDTSMRISHEAIYQALYVQSRGGLTRDLVACLRTGRSLRVPRSRARRRPGGHVTSDVTIDKRPDEVTDRIVAGHWEGDLIIGTDHPAIGTLVERTTRVTMLLHLPRLEGYELLPRVKNGPALAGHGGRSHTKSDRCPDGWSARPDA